MRDAQIATYDALTYRKLIKRGKTYNHLRVYRDINIIR